ncbi:MAG: translation initiation factor IF-3 [Planctomycetota bacterium]
MRVNDAIKVSPVRLISESNEQIGIIDVSEALTTARQAGLDLVEVSPNTNPPVCRIMDYGKWMYQQKRKERQTHKKSHSMGLKEIRLRPEIDPHDQQIKIERAQKFLEKGHKVQFTVMFRGREMTHIDHGHKVLGEIVQTLEPLAKVERQNVMLGRRMTMVMTPR